MRKLNEWAKDRPSGLVIVAQQIALGTDPCFEALKLIKSGDKIEAFSSLPRAKEWVKLYRNHREMQKSVLNFLRRFGKKAQMAAEFAELIFLRRNALRRELENSKKRVEEMRPFEQRKFMSKMEKEVNRVYNLHLADMEWDITGRVDEEFNKKFKKTLNEPGVKFFLKAWIPCWFLYGDYPPRLLRRARLGDIKTIGKLLRFDPSLVNDSRIGEYLHQARARGKGATFERLFTAPIKGPRIKLTLKKMKCSFAGLISVALIMLGQKLGEQEIRTLFDAVAHDMGKGDIDTDLPDSPEAFAKAIQRERAFWMPTLRPDKR